MVGTAGNRKWDNSATAARRARGYPGTTLGYRAWKGWPVWGQAAALSLRRPWKTAGVLPVPGLRSGGAARWETTARAVPTRVPRWRAVGALLRAGLRRQRLLQRSGFLGQSAENRTAERSVRTCQDHFPGVHSSERERRGAAQLTVSRGRGLGVM